MRALIVDDEPIARQVLRELLEELPDMEIAGEAATGTEAIELVLELDPDVLFLDLEMPGMHGLGVVRSLRGPRMPAVIIVTAYQEHAVAAFEVSAVDYLLKPVRKERLESAVNKVRPALGMKLPGEVRTRRIVGRAGSDLFPLEPSDVIAFQADGDLVYILTAKRRYESGLTLKALESKLSSPPFRRIHRGTIINTDHIRRISPLSSKRWLLSMSNGFEAVVSKRMAAVVRDETKW